jgi:hypothetical protein
MTSLRTDPRGYRLARLLDYLETLTETDVADAELVARLKDAKQLKSMVQGAWWSGERGAVDFLSLALVIRKLKEAKGWVP